LHEKTFTKCTIKHSVQNIGIWLVSFRAIKKKLKEYGKKRKRDTSLEFLEYGSVSNSDLETELALVPDPQLQEEYYLPSLPKPPSSYNECRLQLQELNDKITTTLSSPSRRKYKTIRDGIQEFLMRGSLHEIEVMQAHASQIATHKAKLNSRLSLSKGGSILVSDALIKIKEKRRKATKDLVKKAKRRIIIIENKAKEALRV
jgi:hypothetical protein